MGTIRGKVLLDSISKLNDTTNSKSNKHSNPIVSNQIPNSTNPTISTKSTSQPKELSHTMSNPTISTKSTCQPKELSHTISNPTISTKSAKSTKSIKSTKSTSQPKELSHTIPKFTKSAPELNKPGPATYKDNDSIATNSNKVITNSMENNNPANCVLDYFSQKTDNYSFIYDVFPNSSSSLPYIVVKTSHTKESIRLLVDSGSSICIIKNQCLSEPPTVENDILKFKGINDIDTFSETKGKFTLSLELENEVKVPYYFHIVDKINLEYDGILGSNFLEWYKASISYGTSKLIIQDNPLYYFNLKTTPLYKGHITRVIPPRSEMFIRCNVTNPEIQEGLLLDTKIEECPRLYFSRCLVRVDSNNQAVISVLNASENEIILKDIEITLQPVLQIIESDQNTVSLNTADTAKPSSYSTCPYTSERESKVQDLIRCDHLNLEEKTRLRNICAKFQDVFYLEGDKLTHTETLQHEIRVTSETPIAVKNYRFPECHKQEVNKQIKDMLDQNIIRPSISPWSAPIWVVPKKQDASGKPKWRIVIDYRKLNEITIGDAYPIPNIPDILDQLGHSKYFSTLDLVSSFHQVKVKDTEKTAFSVPSGHYEFTRMPFGLRNAPSTFQRLMNIVLSGLQGTHCFTYMDDIVLFGHDLESHCQNLESVLKKLREHNLKLQPAKCEFLRKEVQYLGHVISDQGVKPDPKKVACVQNFPIPKSPRDIKSFLGLVGYYRRFIENFSHITKPLTSLLKKNTNFVWLPEQQKSFDELKHKITAAPILQYPDFSKPFVLTTDASNFAVSAILSQGKIGQDLPVAYASRTLNKAEGNYSTTEKECLAIIFGTKVFRPYLYGQKFIVVTDHKPLQWLFNCKDPSSKLIRWRLKLEEFDYEIVHKKGKMNCNADSLSRNPVLALDSDAPSTSETYEKYLQISQQHGHSYDTVVQEHNDSLLKAKCKMITYPSAIDLDDSIPYCSEILEMSKFKEDLPDIRTLERELYTYQSTSNEKHVFTHLFLRVHHYDEVSYKDIFNILRDYRDMITMWYSEEKEFAISDFQDPFTKLSFNKIFNIICFLFHNTGVKIHIYHNNILFPTPAEIPRILKDNHDSPSAGHPGVSRMYDRLKSQYWWKNMRQDIERYVKNCKSCQVNKPLRQTNRAPMIITSTATKPMEKVFLDVVGPLPETHDYGFKFILTLQDDLTKYSQAYAMKTCSAEETAQKFVLFISHLGIPRMIVTDQGTNFTSEVLKQLERLFGIKHIYASPYHPQTCGALERSHATLKEYLRSYVEDNQHTWSLYLKTAMIAYNTNIHSTTGFQPMELLFGFKPYMPQSADTLDLNTYTDYIRALNHRLYYSRQKALQNIQSSKERSKQHFDAHAKPVTYKVGDMVYLRCHHKQNKAMSPIWKGPYKIIKINGNHTVTLLINRKHVRHHYDEIKIAVDD